MGAYRGNVPRIEADVDRIIRRLRKTKTTLQMICEEYHVAYASLRRVVLEHITQAGYDAIIRKKKRDTRNSGQFGKDRPPTYRRPKGTHFCSATEFKKGDSPHNHRPVGSIKIHNDNCGKKFRWIKVQETGKQSEKYMPYARWLWIQERGDLPAGKFIVHVDGDTLNDDLGNLRAVTRAGHLKLQMQRDPEMVKKARDASSKAAKKRHAQYRKRHGNARIRADVERRISKERAGKEREQMLARLPVRGSFMYECKGCAADFPVPNKPCPKCGHLAFAKIKKPIAATG